MASLRISKAEQLYALASQFGGAVGGGAMGGEEVGGDIYIEGLPMNIDISTLRVLVAPHVIRGSRFFADTRLQPPQLVAYIQLDNRAAAQDVRNKLHGRSIRGYTGRLQVVFAKEAMEPPSSPPQAHPKINSSSNSNSNPKLAAMYQDIYTAPQVPQQQDTNNDVGVPPPLQPISATLSQLQMQLESLRPLLAAYTNSNNANTNSDATSNGTTTNNGINTNSHSHNAQSQPHSNPTSPHLQPVPIPNAILHPNLTATAAGNTQRQS
ncbi:hypothetical protein M422DRAFT_275283 [Sphaerobolus stellatus SS14]|uniref:RRM domain-containing protein n=1 Tax=Sphaerobolus stellatus (strain SS14) TaxID=990650 RepID=A0A0C9UEZ6_SPHS4|nr:hypothetical protein M422DRAFT_275283 [Sphaerobolus stellatus SS14]